MKSISIFAIAFTLASTVLAAPTPGNIERRAPSPEPEAYGQDYHFGPSYHTNYPGTVEIKESIPSPYNKRSLYGSLMKRGACFLGNSGNCNSECVAHVTTTCSNGKIRHPISGNCGGFGGLICNCNYAMGSCDLAPNAPSAN